MQKGIIKCKETILGEIMFKELKKISFSEIKAVDKEIREKGLGKKIIKKQRKQERSFSCSVRFLEI